MWVFGGATWEVLASVGIRLALFHFISSHEIIEKKQTREQFSLRVQLSMDLEPNGDGPFRQFFILILIHHDLAIPLLLFLQIYFLQFFLARPPGGRCIVILFGGSRGGARGETTGSGKKTLIGRSGRGRKRPRSSKQRGEDPADKTPTAKRKRNDWRRRSHYRSLYTKPPGPIPTYLFFL